MILWHPSSGHDDSQHILFAVVNTYEWCSRYLETWVWMNHTICWLHLKFFMQLNIHSSLLVSIFFSCLRTISVAYYLKIIFNTVVELDLNLGKDYSNCIHDIKQIYSVFNYFYLIFTELPIRWFVLVRDKHFARIVSP